MARLPYLDPDEAEPYVAAVLGKAPDLGIFRMVANAQGAFPAWMRFGGCCSTATSSTICSVSSRSPGSPR